MRGWFKPFRRLSQGPPPPPYTNGAYTSAHGDPFSSSQGQPTFAYNQQDPPFPPPTYSGTEFVPGQFPAPPPVPTSTYQATAGPMMATWTFTRPPPRNTLTPTVTVIRVSPVRRSSLLTDQRLISAFTCVFCFCWPFSTMACYYALLGAEANQHQEFNAAYRHNQTAKKLNLIAAFCGTGMYTVVTAFLVFLFIGRFW